MISSIFWSVGLSFVGWILTRIDLESKLLLPAVVHFRPNQTKLSQTEITQWKVEHLRKFPLQEIGISLFLSLPLSAILFWHFVYIFLSKTRILPTFPPNVNKQSQFCLFDKNRKMNKKSHKWNWFCPKKSFSYNFYSHPLFKGSSRTTSKSHHGGEPSKNIIRRNWKLSAQRFLILYFHLAAKVE